ncbi:endo alpha-1,4 polygalactosaminidase [Streptomyces sp. NPDC087437]|uniref:endo alpha-1,4 polygalactosaminidase n=1 Tax=Streptomyces sp. NPDC087437 TaxID=3365789 RepID=UPI0038182B05
MSLLVPLYVHPAEDPGAWHRLIRSAARTYAVVLNPASGPGAGPDPAFTAVAEALRAAGARLLGYVDTDYGTRDAAEVADEVRRHREWYAADGCRKVICYVNVGAWEDFRPDKDAFPRSVLGATNGWDGERWLDIRRLSVLRPIMERRFDMCRDKGFDAVEPDLLEAYSNRTGFPLTARDQLRYNRMIAEVAHERGLSVGLKNDLPQIPQLVGDFDFAVNEECAQYRECERLTPFVKAGKAVFHVEYAVPADGFCPLSRRLGLSSMRKKLELGVWREPC